MAQATALVAGLTDRFTAVPKTHDLVTLGVSPTATATYNALADHANNLTGECYPMMQSLARLLKRAEKTIQRHIDELVEAGLVEKIKRRRDKRGRFLGWLYRLPHLAAAAQRIMDRRAKNRKAYEERKKKQGMEREARRQHRSERKARSSEENRNVGGDDVDQRQRRREGYAWFFGEEPADTAAERAAKEEKRRRREDDVGERRRGYESLFDPPSKEATAPEGSADSFTPSSGHQCPVGSNKSLTSSEISIPPNPPRGADEEEQRSMTDPTTAVSEPEGESGSATSATPPEAQDQCDGALPGRASPDRSAVPGTEGAVSASTVEPGGDAEAAWAAVVRALIERHKDGVPYWFGTYRLVSLSGLTLIVYLANFTLRNHRYGVDGQAADLTIAGYGKELAYLWRQVAGDEDAVLDLRTDGRAKGERIP